MTIDVSYRYRHGRWEAVISTGLRIQTDDREFGAARETVLTKLAAELGVAREAAEARIRRQHVEVDPMHEPEWRGMQFTLLAPSYGVDDPTEDERRRLRECFDLYRESLPEGTRVELYGNRVRIEPGAFGARGDIVNALAATTAEAAPDDVDLQVGPSSTGLDQACEQFRRARAIPVPEGFVRVITDVAGFEDEGDIGHMHLVLKARWNLDRPW